MKEMERKRELRMALICIAVYVVWMSTIESTLGEEKPLLRMVSAMVLLAALFITIYKVKGFGYYGFTSHGPLASKKTLYFLPLLLLATVNLWRGAVMRFSLGDTIFYVLSMLAIGMIEEILFRGFLLKAMLRDSEKWAVIVSSLTFGLGHIVNLLNGAEFLPTMLQIIYAFAIGLMLSMIIIRTNNIIPCCIFHGVFNSLSAFGNQSGQTITYKVVVCIIITVLSLGYAAHLRRTSI